MHVEKKFSLPHNHEHDEMERRQLGKTALRKTKTLHQPHILSYQITNQLTAIFQQIFLCHCLQNENHLT